MTRPEAIRIAKQFRQDADALLQRMKSHLQEQDDTWDHGIKGVEIPDLAAAFRHHALSINALEDCIMRQGMVLKSIGNENPYPNSYNPDSPVVDATADGLRL